MKNSYQSLIERKLAPVGKSGNDTIYVCPNCDDKSGHLWVNYQSNKFHCFKCGFKGRNIASLAIKLGLDVRFDYDRFEDKYSESLDSIIEDIGTKAKRIVDYSRSLRTLTEYYNAHVKPLSPVAHNYLNSRGISDHIIERLRICEGINRYNDSIMIGNKSYEGRDYSGRIMVPSLQKSGRISFYVGRDYTDTKKNKYLNPPKTLAYSSEDVWNLDNVDSKHVIICEGVFTAITAGGLKQNAVATYGKSISARSNSDNPNLLVTCQGEKLLKRGFTTYYVAYDADALSESMNTAKYLHDRGAHVKVVRISPELYGPKADVNDIGYNEFLKLLATAEDYDDFTGVVGP